MAENWDPERYKRQQEDFVVNRIGTSSREVFLAILPNIFSVFFLSITIFRYAQSMNKTLQLFLEFFVVIATCVLCSTILSEHVVEVSGIFFFLSIVQILLVLRQKKPVKVVLTSTTHPEKIQFITNFRALMNVITAVCILAVDFQAFPRKFAKTETFGYSLMDTGVGFFVVANSLVSPEARNVKTDTETNFVRLLSKNVKGCTPLLILGLGRFLAIEFLGYQRHVSEYGVHWNFFLTLAFVKLFTGLISKTFIVRFSLVSGLWLLGMHEYALSSTELKTWVLGPTPRTDFVSANREGLISLPGYVGLYLIGVATGRIVHSAYSAKKKNERWKLEIKLFGCDVDMEYTLPMALCVKLSIVATQACTLTLICDYYLGVSRRLVNLAYCAWIFTISISILTLLLFVDIIIDILGHLQRQKTNVLRRKNSRVESRDATCVVSLETFEAINYNGLVFFLLANLLTGAVNISTKTLYVSETRTIFILIAYMGVNVFAVLYLYMSKVRLRL